MNKMKTLTLIGGISRKSLNKDYFTRIQKLAPEDFEFEFFDITKLPYFSQDIEQDPPDLVTEFKDKIREADCILFITPEYNRSFPGVLKNAIDWGSRPYGQNLWDKKPAAILGASVGNIGTFGAQHHLRQVLAYLNMYTLGQPEVYLNGPSAFLPDGNLVPEVGELLTTFFSSFRELIELTHEKRGDFAARQEESFHDQTAAH